MKVFSTVAVAVLAAVHVAGQALTINTPTGATTCIPLLLAWSGGTPPYFLMLVPANQPNPSALIDFGQLNVTQLTWRVNVAAGTSVNLNLRDNSGVLAQTAPFSILAGSDTSCVGQNLSTTIGPSQSVPNPGPINTSPPATTTGGAGTTGGATTGSTTKTTGSSTGAPSSTSTGAAVGLAGSIGAAGAVVAAVLAALA